MSESDKNKTGLRKEFWQEFTAYAPEVGVKDGFAHEPRFDKNLPDDTYLKLSISEDKVSVYISFYRSHSDEGKDWWESNRASLEAYTGQCGVESKPGKGIHFRSDNWRVGYMSTPSLWPAAFAWIKTHYDLYAEALAEIAEGH